MAALLAGYRFTAEYAPSSRLATGQIGRAERRRIYASDHLGSLLEAELFRPGAEHVLVARWRKDFGFDLAAVARAMAVVLAEFAQAKPPSPPPAAGPPTSPTNKSWNGSLG